MSHSPEILLPHRGALPTKQFSTAELDRIEQRLEKLATTLDSAFVVPGLGIRFGADALMGLVPVLGDLAGTALSAYLIGEARRLGAPASMIGRMAANVAVDTVFGSVPLVGSVFDVFYKANKRNMALLRGHIAELRASNSTIVNPMPRPGART